MNEEKNIYHFLAVQNLDYSSCAIEFLLEAIEEYFNLVQDEKYFSDQMILLSQSLVENRNGMDAIRVNMKSLDLVSPSSEVEHLQAGRRSD